MQVNSTIETNTATTTAAKKGLSTLEPGDFMNILLKQLQYQDPFKPMDNEQMLSQISQIRNMEMSMTLTDSLKTLTEQQRMGSATSMIGQYVTGAVKNADGEPTTLNGVVRGLSFDENGQPVLQLDSGAELPLKDLAGVTDLGRMIGKYVEGQMAGENGEVQKVGGVVQSIRFDTNGEAFLELEDGTVLPASGVTRVAGVPSAATSADATTAVTAKMKQAAAPTPQQNALFGLKLLG